MVLYGLIRNAPYPVEAEMITEIGEGGKTRLTVTASVERGGGIPRSPISISSLIIPILLAE